MEWLPFAVAAIIDVLVDTSAVALLYLRWAVAHWHFESDLVTLLDGEYLKERHQRQDQGNMKYEIWQTKNNKQELHTVPTSTLVTIITTRHNTL